MAVSHFWRTGLTTLRFKDELPTEVQTVPKQIHERMDLGHGLLVGEFNESTECGEVEWVGLITSLGHDGETITVVWRDADFSLRPTPAGKGYWRHRSWFNFSDEVSERYMLNAIFSDIFDAVEWKRERKRSPLARITSREPITPATQKYPMGSPLEGLPYVRESPNPTSGFVYLIWSQYGYKIGKSVNVRNRTRLFEVKLPFSITVMHYARFDDYSQAEKALHKHFHEKRLEGEWFDLCDDDVRFIKTLGVPQPVDVL